MNASYRSSQATATAGEMTCDCEVALGGVFFRCQWDRLGVAYLMRGYATKNFTGYRIIHPLSLSIGCGVQSREGIVKFVSFVLNTCSACTESQLVLIGTACCGGKLRS